MKQKNLTYFNALKAQVIDQFLANNTLSNPNYRDWTGQEIALFQEDFVQKVKSGFSEKWFYTYFKNDAEKLPRIDMLNLMSQYAGLRNFNEFKNTVDLQNKTLSDLQLKNKEVSTPAKPKSKKRYWWLLGLISIPILVGLSFSLFRLNENHFTFCFVEKSNGLPPKTPLRITLLLDNESPLVLQTDENSCFDYITRKKTIKFVVQSTFHEPDTIVRNINSGVQEQIPLVSNDYALMLQYYTSNNTKNWKKRRENLNKLIARNAKIYRLYPQQGISIYSKSEFIDQLTLPTKDLNNIEIIEAQYKDNQIVKLKFKVAE